MGYKRVSVYVGICHAWRMGADGRPHRDVGGSYERCVDITLPVTQIIDAAVEARLSWRGVRAGHIMLLTGQTPFASGCRDAFASTLSGKDNFISTALRETRCRLHASVGVLDCARGREGDMERR